LPCWYFQRFIMACRSFGWRRQCEAADAAAKAATAARVWYGGPLRRTLVAPSWGGATNQRGPLMNKVNEHRGGCLAGLVIATVLCIASTHAAASTYEVLHDFDGKHGAFPNHSMVLDSVGVLHGTTSDRYPKGKGTLFHMNTNGWHFKSDHYFSGAADDGAGASDLTIDASDTIYGTLVGAGPDHAGAIFSDDPINGYQIRAFIDWSMGNLPAGGVTPGPDGALYGTTAWGGDNSSHCGTVFKWDPATKAFTLLHEFTVRRDGCHPGTPLVLRDGILYGNTSQGGPGDKGLIYSVSIHGKKFTTYIPDKGTGFINGLTPDASGNLWGVASFGGAKGAGGIYRITPAGAYEWRASFTLNKGSDPSGELLFGQDGLLYGNTNSGGANGMGTIFSYDPVANVIKRLHDFDGPTGARGGAGLVQDASGAIYGVARHGGRFNYGVIYKFVP